MSLGKILNIKAKIQPYESKTKLDKVSLAQSECDTISPTAVAVIHIITGNRTNSCFYIFFCFFLQVTGDTAA